MQIRMIHIQVSTVFFKPSLNSDHHHHPLRFKLPKAKMGAEEEQEVVIMEEESRSNPNPNPPMTASEFLLWKRQKDADVLAKKEAAARKREEEIAAGTLPMTGRELFLHEPWVFDNNQY